MKILILGGDGYLGWPTAMHLSAHGHDVLVVDNYLKRKLVCETDADPLFNVPNLHERCRYWTSKSGNQIDLLIGDLMQWDFVEEVFSSFIPDAIVHYAEQPSAPFSMLNRNAAALTLSNNLGVTTNLIFAVHEYCPNAHIIKLGTMGEYGTPNIDIEEGWLDINHKGRNDRFLYPRQASSLYHTSKIMDTDLLWFYVRMWGLRVTDLMQGPVYGMFTNESDEDMQLLPSVHYDEIFGTVLNRFVIQAISGYPLTIYGAGDQTRGYLNILDTLNCVRLSIENPAKAGELRIFNQFTETFSVRGLAERVQQAGRSLGLDVQLQWLANPRIEKEKHYYNPTHTGLLNLGLQPTLLNDAVLVRMMKFAMQHKANIVEGRIFRGTKWA